MQIDYEILSNISVDPQSRITLANNTSKVLASYLQLLSNMIYANEKITESELAMIISSLNRWITKKENINQHSYGVGKIVQRVEEHCVCHSCHQYARHSYFRLSSDR